MKTFKDFDRGNNSNVTVDSGEFALFFPNSAFELAGSIATGHPYVSVIISSNDQARLIGARTSGSHFLTGTRTWAVITDKNNGSLRISTYSYERYSSPQFAAGDTILRKLEQSNRVRPWGLGLTGGAESVCWRPWRDRFGWNQRQAFTMS
jgi:hypothetical protein